MSTQREVRWKICETDRSCQHAVMMAGKHMESEPGGEAVVGATAMREKDTTTKEWRLECQEGLVRPTKGMSVRLPGLTVAVVAVAGVDTDVGRSVGCCRGQVQVPFHLDLRVRSRAGRTFGRGSRTAGGIGEKGGAIGG
jgi:hypothetical protein